LKKEQPQRIHRDLNARSVNKTPPLAKKGGGNPKKDLGTYADKSMEGHENCGIVPRGKMWATRGARKFGKKKEQCMRQKKNHLVPEKIKCQDGDIESRGRTSRGANGERSRTCPGNVGVTIRWGSEDRDQEQGPSLARKRK